MAGSRGVRLGLWLVLVAGLLPPVSGSMATTDAFAQRGGVSAVGEATAAAQSASPAPTASQPVLPEEVIDTGDPRSEGEGPGLVGEPLLVLAGIVLVGVVTVVGTVLIARLTGRA